MAYDEFRADYDAVLGACKAARLDRQALAGEISRLTARRDTLTAPAERDRAGADVAGLEELLAAAGQQAGPAPAGAHTRAAAVAGRSHDTSGSTTDRIGRARQGITEIRAIADGVREWDQRIAVLRLTEPLAMLVSALEARQAEGRR